MKSLLLIAAMLVSALAFSQDDKSNRPSPPAQAKQTLKKGTVVTIDYSQPAVKGRTIGVDLEPLPGKVWRTGANEATVFEISKDVLIEGKELPAGKYGLFTLDDGDNWTFIFNKTWKQWGAFNYKESDDALRVTVKAEKAKEFTERFLIEIEKDGEVELHWGNTEVGFKIKEKE
ncbi:MAG: hypothetical protein C4308_03390 [Chitinophagaceae bacterium]